MLRRVMFLKAAVLLLVMVVGWLTTLMIMRFIGDETSYGVSYWAFGLCFVAGLLGLLVTEGLPQQAPEFKVVMVLLATLIRMGTVLGFGALLYYQVPVIRERGMAFIAWIIGFYLVTLAVETGLLLYSNGQQTTNNGNGRHGI